MVLITPPAQAILTQLGIFPSSLSEVSSCFRRTNCRAVINWLTRYRPTDDATQLEQVKGYLEAFHHLCTIEEWDRAFTLISTRLNTPTQEILHYQLKLWGYYQEQIDLYAQLADRVSPKWNSGIYNCLGATYQALGNYSQAINYFRVCC